LQKEPEEDLRKISRIFFGISYGSACELETQLIVARNLEYLTKKEFDLLFNEINEIQKMLFVLEKKQKE
jgi:four helix bundle protein